jgi:hypothetical protein
MLMLPPLEAAAQTPAAAPAAGAKEAAIRRLLEVTGAGQMGVQVMDGLLGSFKKASPAVPDSFWAEFRSEVRAEDLLDLCVPIYAKHFSEDDVRAVIAFYETPAGKRLVKAQPLIMQESMQAGQEWGRTLAQKVIARLKEKGYQQ